MKKYQIVFTFLLIILTAFVLTSCVPQKSEKIESKLKMKNFEVTDVIDKITNSTKRYEKALLAIKGKDESKMSMVVLVCSDKEVSKNVYNTLLKYKNGSNYSIDDDIKASVDELGKEYLIEISTFIKLLDGISLKDTYIKKNKNVVMFGSKNAVESLTAIF